MDPAWIAGAAAVISSGAAIWAATNGNRTLNAQTATARLALGRWSQPSCATNPTRGGYSYS
jgi:hypothetical protein